MNLNSSKIFFNDLLTYYRSFSVILLDYIQNNPNVCLKKIRENTEVTNFNQAKFEIDCNHMLSKLKNPCDQSVIASIIIYDNKLYILNSFFRVVFDLEENKLFRIDLINFVNDCYINDKFYLFNDVYIGSIYDNGTVKIKANLTSLSADKTLILDDESSINKSIFDWNIDDIFLFRLEFDKDYYLDNRLVEH